MCGIVGYIGTREKKAVILGGLKELEYRGYDSAGMVVEDASCDFSYFKAVGKLTNLASKMGDFHSAGLGVAIGHTRWATHGKPTEINAHPHLGEYSFVIHNGIIENYKELKDELAAAGVAFASQTDTEVIVALFEFYNRTAASAFEAYARTISRLRGAYATLLVTKAAPGEVFFAKNAAPLIVAVGGDFGGGLGAGGAGFGGGLGAGGAANSNLAADDLASSQASRAGEKNADFCAARSCAGGADFGANSNLTQRATQNGAKSNLNNPNSNLNSGRHEIATPSAAARNDGADGANGANSNLARNNANGANSNLNNPNSNSSQNPAANSADTPCAGEIFFASSDAPLIGLAKNAAYLEDGVYGRARLGHVEFYDAEGEPLALPFAPLPKDKGYAQKDGYRFFMEKEIFEQGAVAAECLMGRVGGEAAGGGVSLEVADGVFDGVDEVVFCACGTSWHAAMAMSYLFERLARVRVKVEIASEFRYKEPLLRPSTLFVVISQSGETADTLEALKIAKAAGLKTLAICNVDNSSIVRLAQNVILTRAGIEKGVASTKAFATQVLCLWMVALRLAVLRGAISRERLDAEVQALRAIPQVLRDATGQVEHLRKLAKHYLHGHGFFFIGRDMFYPLALEGALKLKEISYLHAEGYPAGEMKHGPIALADERLFTIALLPRTMLYEKTKSNVEELASRDSYITVVSPTPLALADDFIQTGDYDHPMLEFFEMMVVVQLLALEISVRLGNDVDMPRNLAKSVTVE